MATGSSLALPTLSTGIVLSLPMDKAGVGSAVNDTTREVGGAVGIAVIGSILAAQYRSGIASAAHGTCSHKSPRRPRKVSALSPEFTKAVPDTPGLRQLLTVARSAFVDGMQIGLRVSAAHLARGRVRGVALCTPPATCAPRAAGILTDRPGIDAFECQPLTRAADTRIYSPRSSIEI